MIPFAQEIFIPGCGLDSGEIEQLKSLFQPKLSKLFCKFIELSEMICKFATQIVSMETFKKEYLNPSIWVLDVQNCDVLCLSDGDDAPDYTYNVW